jgi:prepilin-type N-terminal cleavage/methylation domain-containing protein
MIHSIKHGFTLIELAVVLVIIALVTGGIMVGQDLVRSADLNSMLSDVDRYKGAVRTFEMKYKQFPGDMSNATGLWSSCTDSGGNPCNGNGNYLLDTQHESKRFWQHLALAELISSSHEGLDLEDAPDLSIKGGRVYAKGSNPFIGANSLTLAKTSNGFGYLDSVALSGLLSPAEALKIDRKIDDGEPIEGNLHGTRPSGGVGNPICYSFAAGPPIDYFYLLSVEEAACRMHFKF